MHLLCLTNWLNLFHSGNFICKDKYLKSTNRTITTEVITNERESKFKNAFDKYFTGNF